MIPSLQKNASKKNRTPAAIAARAVVQILFATGKNLTIEALRLKLREFFKPEVRPEVRAAAALTNLDLVTALLEVNGTLAEVGLQIRITNGVVSLITSHVDNRGLAEYLRVETEQSGNLVLTTATLEVLACIAFKQPISQSEIDKIFATDKRTLVLKLREIGLVEEFPGTDGRLRFATTEAFLRQFNMASIEELHRHPSALG